MAQIKRDSKGRFIKGGLPYNVGLPRELQPCYGKKTALGYKHTEETKIKIGLNNKRLGTKHTQETKDKIRLSRIGYKMSQTTKEKISMANRGANNYQWIKDRTLLKDDHKDRGGQFHKEWSKNVRNRDNWSCRIADINCDGKVVAHHILPWRDFLELRYEVNNGITLCHFHHPRKRNDEMRLSPYFQELVKVQ